MFAIVGLGNPGERYANNRHNVGFRAVSVLAARHALAWSEHRHHARIATGVIRGQRVIMAKPSTYMNESGTSVAPLVRWHKVEPTRELIVVYDDMDLPFGTLRIRASGSAGGQNGMKSIIQHLGTETFPRLRLGIGRPPQGWESRDYVLTNWRPEEAEPLREMLERAADAVELWLTEGLAQAMNVYNQVAGVSQSPKDDGRNVAQSKTGPAS
ncbi:MAG: aminoacyl-tRNA hydrolase [Herpetosiphon sp.]